MCERGAYMDRNDKTLIKIARWYYILGLTQDEIAKRLSTTRQTVNKMINSLEDKGIISIKINGMDDNNIALESYFEDEFELKQVIIADVFAKQDSLQEVAYAAAEHITSIIEPTSIIGVSWGETLSLTVGNMRYEKHQGCKVVQLIGVQNFDYKMYKTDQIALSLSNKLDCPSYMLYAPAIVDNPEVKRLLLEEKAVQSTLRLIAQCDIALVGIGQLNMNATMCKQGFFSSREIDHLHTDGFFGDVCVNPVRRDGSWDHCFLHNRLINTSIESLQKISNVVAIASGEDKAEAILSCLKTKCINTLIIDQFVAKKIMRIHKKT